MYAPQVATFFGIDVDTVYVLAPLVATVVTVGICHLFVKLGWLED